MKTFESVVMVHFLLKKFSRMNYSTLRWIAHMNEIKTCKACCEVTTIYVDTYSHFMGTKRLKLYAHTSCRFHLVSYPYQDLFPW